jgi:thioredoxin reductase (NADPH)
VTIRDALIQAKNIAVVGLSKDETKVSNRVARYLKSRGYRIFPVNPNAQEILGEPSYSSLKEVPEKIDIVNVFRPSGELLSILQEAIDVDAGMVWAQLGISHGEAAEKAASVGMPLVMDKCIMVEHRRLIGGEGMDLGDKKKYQLIIVGAGPAGLTAAIYSTRSRIDTLVIEKAIPGGQAFTTAHIANYPGFQEISGPELMENMERQAKALGANFVTDDVSELKVINREMVVSAAGGEYLADAVIVATGAQPRELDVAGERTLRGRGVSYCATCDGPLYKDKKLLVVGGGDAAVEEALFLTRYASSVTIIHRRDQLRATKILQEAAFSNDKISFLWDSVVSGIEGDEALEGVRVKNVKTGQEERIQADGVFVYVGTVPSTDFVKGVLTLDANGYIITDEEMATLVPGIFAAGDVRKKSLRQIVTAAGDGAVAATSVKTYLDRRA